MTDAPPNQKLIELPGAPEIFVDGISGFFLHHQNLRLTFEASRVDHAQNPGPVTRHIVARVIMPSAGARTLAVGLFDFLKKMGLEPGNVAPSVTVQSAKTQPAAEPTPKPIVEVTPAGPALVDQPGAPELYADGAIGFYLNHGILRIALEAQRFDHANAGAPAYRVVVGRIAMPTTSASALAVNLFDFLKKMGIDPASVSGGPTMQ